MIHLFLQPLIVKGRFSNLIIASSHQRSPLSGDRSQNSRTTEGFTLLEGIIVMAVIGVLTAVAAPSWVGFNNRQRINSTRDEIVQAIRTTQSNARLKRRGHTITFKPNAASGIPELDLEGLPVVLGNGNLKANMVDMTVTDGANNAVTSLEFIQDGSISTDVALPIKIVVSPSNSGTKRCIFVESLLGSVRSEANNDCP